MGEIYEKSMARTSFTLVMLAIAGGMALALGMIGLYGTISYSVAQRTREIGIRMAMGAQRGTLTGMFLRHGLALSAIGIACGLGIRCGSDARHEIAVVRSEAGGPADVCVGPGGAHRCRPARELSPRLAGDGRRPARSATRRLIFVGRPFRAAASVRGYRTISAKISIAKKGREPLSSKHDAFARGLAGSDGDVS